MKVGSKEATRNPHDTAGARRRQRWSPCPTRTPALCPPARMSRTPPAMATFSRRASLRSRLCVGSPCCSLELGKDTERLHKLQEAQLETSTYM